MNRAKLMATINISAMIVVVLLALDNRSADARSIERLDLSVAGSEGNAGSGVSSVNATGNDVAFSSGASNLVPNDLNGKNDIFVFDWANVTMSRISVDSSGAGADDDSSDPVISAEGRYVAFASAATNLVAGDTNGNKDIFIYDRVSETIDRVSVDGSGVQADGSSHTPAISADGRYVAFSSDAANLVAGDTNGLGDVFLYDRTRETVVRVSVSSGGTQGDQESREPAISADGRYVAFSSDAANLVAGDTNGLGDVFLYDRTQETVVRVSVSSGGVQGDQESREPAISADGRYVAFSSDAANLVAGDTNNAPDIFVADRSDGTIERISVDNLGVQGNNGSRAVCLNEDGDFIVFSSLSSNLVAYDTNGSWDIFVSIADTANNNNDDDDDDDDKSGTIHFNCFISTIMGR